MSILQDWFNEAKKANVTIFGSGENEFIIYKGFKLSKSSNLFKLEDVRRSDFYDDVKDKEYKTILKLGFIKGIDWIVNKRNLKRIGIYTRILERLYSEKKEYKSKLRPKITRAFYQKKLKNCQESIYRNIDLLFLYKTRIEQYNLKYNLNEKIKN